ncbi:MAG: MbtH family protein [Caldilineales bacterium]
MSTLNRDDQFKVVINHEEQYSLWPARVDNPSGWRDAGAAGSPQDCIRYIERITADSNPRALKQRIQELQR